MRMYMHQNPTLLTWQTYSRFGTETEIGRRPIMSGRESPQPPPTRPPTPPGLACLFCAFRALSAAALDRHYLTVHHIGNTNVARAGVSVYPGGGYGESTTEESAANTAAAAAAATAAMLAARQLPTTASAATTSALALSLTWLQLLSRQTLQPHHFLQQQQRQPLQPQRQYQSRTMTPSRQIALPLPPPPTTPQTPPPQPPPPLLPPSTSSAASPSTQSQQRGRRLSAATSSATSGRNVESLARKVWALGGSLNCLPSAHYSATCRRCGREVKLTERKVQKFKLHIQSCYRKLLRASVTRATTSSSADGD